LTREMSEIGNMVRSRRMRVAAAPQDMVDSSYAYSEVAQ